MNFKELQDQLENDLTFTEDSIQQKCLGLSRLYQKYLRILTGEKKSLNELEQKRKDLYSKLYHKLIKEGYDGYDVGKVKNAIETYINMNAEYRAVALQIAQDENVIKYLEGTLDNLNKVSFSIKNYIDLAKMKAGIS